MLRLVDGRLKQLGIADLLHLSQRTLLLQPVDERLHGCVSNAFLLRQAFQDLAHGRRPQFPVLFQDASFGFGKTRLFHDLLLTPAMLLQGAAYWLSRLLRSETTLWFVIDKRACKDSAPESSATRSWPEKRVLESVGDYRRRDFGVQIRNRQPI